jgi:hypothetical protein
MEQVVRKILDHSKISSHIYSIAGGNMGVTTVKDDGVLRTATINDPHVSWHFDSCNHNYNYYTSKLNKKSFDFGSIEEMFNDFRGR